MSSRFSYFNRPRHQQGIATMIIGLLILVLMSVMTYFAINVGVFEQRTSANEMRAKQAFQTSEAGLHGALEFIKANQAELASGTTNGWLNSNSRRWVQCTNTNGPCGQRSPGLSGIVYKYEVGGSNDVPIGMTLDATRGSSYSVEALLCIIDMDSGACVDDSNPTTNIALQLVASGQNADAIGQAAVSMIVAPFRLINANVDAPIVVANTFAGSGTFSLVTNPNGGGRGVPLSVWSNADVNLSTNSNAASCHFEEFYATGTPVAFDGTTICNDCDCPSDEARLLTGNVSDGIDIVDVDGDQGPTPDATNFPTDLFKYVFGVPAANYQEIKDIAAGNGQVFPDCSGITSASSGLIWIEGDCVMAGSVSSPSTPVLMVLAGDLRVNAGGVIFGLFFVTDVESGVDPRVQLNGGPTVYGAIVSDTNLDLGNGNIEIVYNEDVLSNIANSPTFTRWGPLPGTWLDFIDAP